LSGVFDQGLCLMLILVTAFLLILSLPVLATDVQKAKNIRGFAKE